MGRDRNKIKLSVIIPAYNQEQLVLQAIDSIPERNDIEIIVIDDCSFDDTFECCYIVRLIEAAELIHKSLMDVKNRLIAKVLIL